MNKVIEVNNLSYKYPNGYTALNDINLNIYENESVAIIGSNGAGKSTFLLSLTGVLDIVGKINILRIPLNNKKNINEIRKRIGFVFQDPDYQLFMPTIYDDIAFGPLNLNYPKDEIKIRVEESLKQTNLTSKKDFSSYHLSFGEQKRAAIATILSMKPEIMLLDEPTANLDRKNEISLLNFIKSIKATKLIATHSLKVAEFLCDRIVIFDEGKIINDIPIEKIDQIRENFEL